MSRLKELRKKNGYTKTEIQKLTGIEQCDYSRLERGERALTLGECMILATLFNTSVDYLLDLTDDPIPHPRK